MIVKRFVLPLALLFVFIVQCPVVSAQLRLPALLSSGMVLQQNDSVQFWGWANPSEPISITTGWDNQTYSLKAQNIGRWITKIKTPAAGGPYSITVKGWGAPIVLNDVLIGEVWLCSGQSNMEWSYNNGAKPVKEELPVCYNNNIRFLHVPRTSAMHPQDDVPVAWKVCDSNSLKSFSAIAYFFGKKINKELNVPVGLINSSWGGTSAEAWTPTEAIESDVILKTSAYKLKEVPWGPVKPGLNFNGMIAPLIHYNIAGALWYQGEANTINGETYSRLLKTMIDNWRRLWKKDFPFYYVQIAPYAYGRPYEGAVVMEQQSKLMQYPGCGMVVVTDLIDSVTNIHPSNKLDVGNRLANWALAETYHKNMGAYKSPVYKSMVAKGNKIVVTIADAPNGLVRKGKAITGFYIAGTNNEWLPAEATIDGSSITVWNNKIAAPVQVRYSFGNTIVGNVFSKEGLPLCPFRTDNEKL